MNYRKLRIAWTVRWAIAGLLVIALWVRSYWYIDRLSGRGFGKNDFAEFMTGRGLTGLVYRRGIYRNDGTSNWRLDSLAATPNYQFPQLGEYRCDSQAGIVMLPNWLSITMAMAVAALPRLRWRFSLRTLLIATMLVAVLLGLIVFAVRG